MLGTAKIYNLKAVQFVIGGVPISGGYTDDALTLTPDGDLFEMVNGADGNTVLSRTNIDTWALMVSLSEASPPATLLDGVVRAALLATSIPGVPALLPGTIIDPLSGETTSWASAAPMRYPDRSKGPVAGSRKYLFMIKDPIFTPGILNLVR